MLYWPERTAGRSVGASFSICHTSTSRLRLLAGPSETVAVAETSSSSSTTSYLPAPPPILRPSSSLNNAPPLTLAWTCPAPSTPSASGIRTTRFARLAREVSVKWNAPPRVPSVWDEVREKGRSKAAARRAEVVVIRGRGGLCWNVNRVKAPSAVHRLPFISVSSLSSGRLPKKRFSGTYAERKRRFSLSATDDTARRNGTLHLRRRGWKGR